MGPTLQLSSSPSVESEYVVQGRPPFVGYRRRLRGCRAHSRRDREGVLAGGAPAQFSGHAIGSLQRRMRGLLQPAPQGSRGQVQRGLHRVQGQLRRGLLPDRLKLPQFPRRAVRIREGHLPFPPDLQWQDLELRCLRVLGLWGE